MRSCSILQGIGEGGFGQADRRAGPSLDLLGAGGAASEQCALLDPGCVHGLAATLGGDQHAVGVLFGVMVADAEVLTFQDRARSVRVWERSGRM